MILKIVQLLLKFKFASPLLTWEGDRTHDSPKKLYPALVPEGTCFQSKEGKEFLLVCSTKLDNANEVEICRMGAIKRLSGVGGVY